MITNNRIESLYIEIYQYLVKKKLEHKRFLFIYFLAVI